MFRIIEEKETITGKSLFYIQEKKRFLFWQWWSYLTVSNPFSELEYYCVFDTYEKAKEKYDKLTQKIEVIVRYP